MTASIVKHKRGTSIQWASATYILKDGEIGIDKTLNKIKVGNGSSLWPDLPFINVLPSELTELAQDAVEAALTAGTGITKTYNDTANTVTLAVDSTIANKTYVDTAVSGLQSASIQIYIPLSLLGQVDGVAELDSNGVIPDAQIPAGITRDTELSSAISTEVTNRNTAIATAKSEAIADATSQVSALIAGAPAALNTLDELAAALGDDANYAATITTALGTKEPTLPVQTGNAGKFLTTDGTSKSWSTVAQYTLPAQTSNSGKFLTTNGTVESWATIPVTSAATYSTLGTVYGLTSSTNAFIGQNAGKINTSTQNVAVGFDALKSNINGFGIVAIGYSALPLATGNANTAVGNNSAYALTTGVNGAYFGYGAGIATTTGDENTAIGMQALTTNITGAQNVAVGSGSLEASKGDGNIGIGRSAGYNLASGSNNIIIGTTNQFSGTSVSNEITIGNASNNRFRIPGLAVNWTTSAYGRATYASTSAPSGGADGDVWLVYTP